MPYIKEPRREALAVDPDATARTPGELNYQFTSLALTFLDDHGMSYTNLNAIMGAFESAKAEFYRRVIAPYEDKKIEENGDVY